MAEQRDHWSSRAGFVLAATGSAVGLGNLWKFPYIAWENDGGAFVLVYLVCVLVVGMPIMIAEIMIGRGAQVSAVGAFKKMIGPAWGFVGGLGVLTGFVLLGYYSVIAGWSLRNFAACMRWSFKGFPVEADLAAGFGHFLGDGTLQFVTTTLFMVATIFVVYRGVGKGIEKVARTLMPVLLAILAALLVSAMLMPGAGQALSFLFRPNFAELEPASVLEALGHSFFTLSLGMGAMVTYGSYMSRKESVVRASMTVVILDTVIALVASAIMFSVIFSTPGLAESIGKSTVGMLFITLPTQFYTHIPLGTVLAPLFYVLVGFAALTSTVSILEVVTAYFVDEHKISRKKAALGSGLMILIVGLLCAMSNGAVKLVSEISVFEGKTGLLDNLDHLVSNWFLPVGGFLITLTVGWLLSPDTARRELDDGTAPGWFSFGAWHFFIRFVAPIAVGLIIVFVLLGRDFS
jgi:NSS family neurotransmitter:Na+ symporter